MSVIKRIGEWAYINLKGSNTKLRFPSWMSDEDIVKATKEGKGLDMSTEARMQRAKEQGFGDEIYYHGTNRDFSDFDINAKGEYSSPDTDGVITLTPNELIASSYAKNAQGERVSVKGRSPLTSESEYKKLTDEVNSRLKAFNIKNESGQDAVKEWNNLRQARRKLMFAQDSYHSAKGANVIPVRIRGDIKRVNADGMQHDSDFMIKEQRLAKDEGYDGVQFVGMKDDPSGMGGMLSQSDTIQVFDPKNIRSINAAFDPAQKESSNLLASAAPTSLAGILGYNALTPNVSEASEFKPTTKRKMGFDPEYNGSQAIGIPDGWRGNLHDLGTHLKQNYDFPLGGTWFENLGDYMTDLAEGQEKSIGKNFWDSLMATLDVLP